MCNWYMYIHTHTHIYTRVCMFLMGWMHHKVVCQSPWLFTWLGLLSISKHFRQHFPLMGQLRRGHYSFYSRSSGRVELEAKLRQVHERDFLKAIKSVVWNQMSCSTLQAFRILDIFISLIPNYGFAYISCLPLHLPMPWNPFWNSLFIRSFWQLIDNKSRTKV